MKIRKDFVTNSSSSNFVTAVVEMIPSIVITYGAAASLLSSYDEEDQENMPEYIIEVIADGLVFNDLKDQGSLDIKIYEVSGGNMYEIGGNVSVQCNCPQVVVKSNGNGSYHSEISLSDIPGMKKAEINITVFTPAGKREPVIQLNFETRIEIETKANKKSIMANDDDELILKAKFVSLSMTQEEIIEANQSIEFGLSEDSKQAEGLLYYETVVPVDDYMEVTFKASPPPKEDDSSELRKIPATIIATGMLEQKSYQDKCKINLVEGIELNIKDEYVEILMDSGQSQKVKAWLNEEDTGEWEFEVEFDDSQREQERIVDIIFENKSATEIEITLTDNGYQLDEGVVEIICDLVVRVKQGSIEAERQLRVALCQEGLFTVKHTLSDGKIVVNSDAEKDDPNKKSFVEFSIAKWNEQTKSLDFVNTDIESLVFEDVRTEDENLKKMLDLFEFVIEFKEKVPSNRPSGRFEMYVDKQMIHKSKSQLEGVIEVSHPENDEVFWTEVPISFKTVLPDDFEDDWDFEVKSIRKIINTYLPEPLRSQKLEDFEAKKNNLGASDIYELRHEIWDVAYELMMEEVKYWEDEAAWIDKEITALEWTAWVGDRAFGVLMSTFTSPMGGYAISQFKDVVIDLICQLQTNSKPFDEFIFEWGQSKLVLFADKGGEELIKLKAEPNSYKWLAFYFSYKVGFHYVSDFDENGHPKGIIEALKAAAWDVTGTAIEDAIGPFAEQIGIKHGYITSKA